MPVIGEEGGVPKIGEGVEVPAIGEGEGENCAEKRDGRQKREWGDIDACGGRGRRRRECQHSNVARLCVMAARFGMARVRRGQRRFHAHGMQKIDAREVDGRGGA